MRHSIRLNLNVLMYREDQWWIAHCLEMDLPAEGATPGEALQNLMDLVNVQVTTAVDESNLNSIFSPAPPTLWAMYAKAKDSPIQLARTKRPGVNRLEVRELVCS